MQKVLKPVFNLVFLMVWGLLGCSPPGSQGSRGIHTVPVWETVLLRREWTMITFLSFIRTLQ